MYSASFAPIIFSLSRLTVSKQLADTFTETPHSVVLETLHSLPAVFGTVTVVSGTVTVVSETLSAVSVPPAPTVTAQSEPFTQPLTTLSPATHSVAFATEGFSSLTQGSVSGSGNPAPTSTAQISSVDSDSSMRHGVIIGIALGSSLGGIFVCVLSALLLIRRIKTRRRLQSLTQVEEGTGNIVAPYAGTASSAPQVKTERRDDRRNISVRRNFSRMAEEIQQLRGQVMRLELESWSRRPVGEEAGEAPPEYATHGGD